MDKWQAIQSFWESFDIPAYDQNSVPDDAVAPYITYEAIVDEFENPILPSASIWYKSSSWKDISKKADQIANYIGAYRVIPLNNHEYLYLSKGSPFAQRLSDEDSRVKRIYINLSAEFFTSN